MESERLNRLSCKIAAMTVKEGDFVLLDYTGTVNSMVFDTTMEAVAKENNMFMPERQYRPLVIAAGKGDVIKGMDKELIGMKKGDEKKLNINPEDGYGSRNPELIKIIPLKVFNDNKMNPFPGMPVQLDGMTARVQSVSGGRVRVDFNHELAGKTLDFNIKIIDVLTKDEDKIQALANQFFQKDDLTLEFKDDKVIATPKQEILSSKAYAQSKAYFITQVTDKFAGKSVEFVEEYKKPAEKA